MLRGDRDHDTICAISTPPGSGAISIIRISGKNAIQAIRKIAGGLTQDIETHKAYLCILKSISDGQPIDEVIVTVFLNDKSFTGEESVEISCHGSQVIVDWILQELIVSGCRFAEPGEFTYRAFMNGKIDLVQAESVLDIIESRSRLAARQALRQLKGALSIEMHNVEDKLLWLLAHIEAGIDFSTEGIEVIDTTTIYKRINEIINVILELLKSYKSGRIANEGLKIVLSGEPNVGKSSLLNLLAEEEKAIVTDIAGTTRDLVEARIGISGYNILFVDTAGLREAKDKVEKIGIEKSKTSQLDADLNFFIIDLSKNLSATELYYISQIPKETLFLVGNKSDIQIKSNENTVIRITKELMPLMKEGYFDNLNALEQFVQKKYLSISSISRLERDKIISVIQKALNESYLGEQTHLYHARHFESLSHCLERLEKARSEVERKVSPELYAIALKEALMDVQNVLGKRYDDDILDRIFKEFCLGK